MIGHWYLKRRRGHPAPESPSILRIGCSLPTVASSISTSWQRHFEALATNSSLQGRLPTSPNARTPKRISGEQKTIFVTHVSSSQRLLDWRPSLNLQGR